MIYTDENRGSIQYRERAKQLIEFNNLQFKRHITPTNIDGFFEYDNKAFIFYELKLKDKDTPYGQRLALMRVVDAINATGRNAALFVCSHNVEDPKQDVDAAAAMVTECYLGERTKYLDEETGKPKVWRKDQKNRNAKQISIDFLKYALGDEAKDVIPEGGVNEP